MKKLILTLILILVASTASAEMLTFTWDQPVGVDGCELWIHMGNNQYEVLIDAGMLGQITIEQTTDYECYLARCYKDINGVRYRSSYSNVRCWWPDPAPATNLDVQEATP